MCLPCVVGPTFLTGQRSHGNRNLPGCPEVWVLWVVRCGLRGPYRCMPWMSIRLESLKSRGSVNMLDSLIRLPSSFLVFAASCNVLRLRLLLSGSAFGVGGGYLKQSLGKWCVSKQHPQMPGPRFSQLNTAMYQDHQFYSLHLSVLFLKYCGCLFFRHILWCYRKKSDLE